jgi:uncharacterized protein (DUF427 family)
MPAWNMAGLTALDIVMKIPGPDHPITIEPNPKRVRVTFAGRIIADSGRALTLRETTYAPALYIPREDTDMLLLERSAQATYCPYKGDAAYYSIRVGDRLAQNAAWTYERPFAAVADIAGRLAFYRDRVELIEEI